VDDVTSNVLGQLQGQGSGSTLPSTVIVQEDAVDNVLRLVLEKRNEELERELRGLRFLLWRANPKSKAELEHMVKLMLPLHHEVLMKIPVEDYVVHWQAAIVRPGHGMDDRILENDTDSQAGEGAILETKTSTLAAIAK
jgi:hypothetical protein